MNLIETVAGLRKALDADRAAGHSVGLVPTMGALHEGHLSLVRRAVEECDVVTATIFVNPLQFGPGEDLGSYPRHLDADAVLVEAAGVDHLFAPPVAEMFPDPPRTTVHVAEVGDDREGRFRPGHFDGVATVVAKLFNAAGPCRAYFGEKDHQQLQVVRRMAADLSFPVDVVACPTVREDDGLALSSRNAYLSPAERAAAPVLYQALLAGKALVEQGATDPAVLGAAMAAVVAAEPLATLDYADAVPDGAGGDGAPLRRGGRGWGPGRAMDGAGPSVRLYVAARVGTTRLIDNLEATAP